MHNVDKYTEKVGTAEKSFVLIQICIYTRHNALMHTTYENDLEFSIRKKIIFGQQILKINVIIGVVGFFVSILASRAHFNINKSIVLSKSKDFI